MRSRTPTLLFVYGTLRSDPRHEMFHLLARNARFVSNARVAGRLYDLGAYPGMSLSDDGSYVKGEIYEVNPHHWSDVIQQLDAYEGCTDLDPEPHEYRRELVTAELPSDTSVDAWAYVLNANPHDRREIVSGDYLTESVAGVPL